MKKHLQILLFAALMLLSTNVFAKEKTNSFWKEYGAGLAAGQMMVTADLGLSNYTVANHGSGKWYKLPQIGATFDYVLPFALSSIPVNMPSKVKNFVAPLSVGGYINSDMFGCKEVSIFYNVMSFGGSVKYHMDLSKLISNSIMKNVDVYTGLKLGFAISMNNNAYSGKGFGMNMGWMLGGDYYFADNLAVNVEFDLPLSLKAGVTYKIK